MIYAKMDWLYDFSRFFMMNLRGFDVEHEHDLEDIHRWYSEQCSVLDKQSEDPCTYINMLKLEVVFLEKKIAAMNEYITFLRIPVDIE